MAHEEWRDVVGFEGYYQVSNLGAVRSLDRLVTTRDQRTWIEKGRIKSQRDTNGYLYVHLSKNGRKFDRGVHRLVAEAFLERPDGCDYVDHIDGVRTNNAASNLRFCTQLQNVHYSMDAGRLIPSKNMKQLHTEEAKKARLEATRRPVLRSDGMMFESIRAAAKALGHTPTAVSNVLRGRTKTCNGYTFKYV